MVEGHLRRYDDDDDDDDVDKQVWSKKEEKRASDVTVQKRMTRMTTVKENT